MPASRADTIWATTGVPALLAAFGVPATRVNADADESAITVILEQRQDALLLTDPWPQRQWTITVAKSVAPAPGDSFVIAGDATDDDPYPDDMTWRADAVLSDDGITVTLAVRRQ